MKNCPTSVYGNFPKCIKLYLSNAFLFIDKSTLSLIWHQALLNTKTPSDFTGRGLNMITVQQQLSFLLAVW
jgi:hypothetical protein